MARKSKDFRELLKQKQAEKKQQKVIKTLEKRLKTGVLGEQLATIEKRPNSEIKMSEVLEEFVEPYLADTIDEDEVKTLFYMGVIAWNASLVPESDRQGMMDDLFKTLFKDDDPAFKQEIKDVINEMIQRKQKLFADNQRFIMDFELQGSGDEFHLSVASLE